MKRFYIISAALLVFSTPAFAGNVESFGIGARATALGGAYSATADDPFAAYYNPAGLTQIDSPMISTGVSLMDPALKVHQYRVKNSSGGYFSDGTQTFSPKNFEDSSDDLFVPHLGFAMPINDQMSVGVAAYLPWGLDIEWTKNTDKNPGAYNTTRSYYLREVVNPSFAYKINDQFSVGMGVAIGKSKSGAERMLYFPTTAASVMTGALMSKGYTQTQAAGMVTNVMTLGGGQLPASNPAPALIGDADYKKLLAVQATNLNHNDFLKAEMEDDVNYSFNLGFMYKPTNSVSLGLTYRSKTDTDFEGDVRIEGKKVADVKMDYDHPDQLQAGLRYRPHDKISMEADIVWTFWRHLEYQKEVFTKLPGAPAWFPSEKTYERDWNNTTQVRLGVEWYALDYMTVRAGYFYDPSPVPDKTFDIMWPDADRKTYSLGLGFNLGESWTIDTALQYAIAETPRTLGGESGHNLNDSYNPLLASGLDNGARGVVFEADGNIWGYSVTANYKF